MYPDHTNSPWVLLLESMGMPQAEMLRSSLEACDIPARLNQEGAGRTLGLVVGPLGGVEIWVPEEHLAAAQTVLHEFFPKMQLDEDPAIADDAEASLLDTQDEADLPEAPVDQ